jgi:hypothetical protein
VLAQVKEQFCWHLDAVPLQCQYDRMITVDVTDDLNWIEKNGLCLVLEPELWLPLSCTVCEIR